MALRAKFKFETDVFFMILLRKIMKNTSVSKEYSAAAGGKILFTQPLSIHNLAQSANKNLFTSLWKIPCFWHSPFYCSDS